MQPSSPGPQPLPGIMKTLTDRRVVDIAGQTFGRVTVLGRAANKPGRRAACWTVQCSCGNPKIWDVRGDQLRSGGTKSCGCLQKEAIRRIGNRNLLDLTGRVFGRLTVIERTQQASNTRNARWLCQCSCGNPMLVSVSGLKLTSGNTVSCGCFHSQQSAKWAGVMNSGNLDGGFGDQLVELYLAEIGGQFLKVGIAANLATRESVAKADNNGKRAYTKIFKTWVLRRRKAIGTQKRSKPQVCTKWADGQSFALGLSPRLLLAQ